jgi:hypothetical protein
MFEQAPRLSVELKLKLLAAEHCFRYYKLLYLSYVLFLRFCLGGGDRLSKGKELGIFFLQFGLPVRYTDCIELCVCFT